MKKAYLLIAGLILVCGCVQKEEVVMRINDFKLTKAEFDEELKEKGLISPSIKDKEEFLESLINRKLILLEAERIGLDKEKEFLKGLEDFYEATLVKEVLDRKSKELTARVSVNEDEIQSRYNKMVEDKMTDKSYEEIYEQLRWQLLREKQNRAFSDWQDSLKSKAKIKINKELIGIREER